jgi:hypothetical protein
VIAALEATSEAEAAAARADGVEDYDERQRGALKALATSSGPEARAAAAKAYAQALFSEFSWAEEDEGGDEAAAVQEEEVAKRALATLLQDAHEAAALRGKTDATTVLAELAAGATAALASGTGDASGLLLQRVLLLAAGAGGGGGGGGKEKEREKEVQAALHARERGYQATVRRHLQQLHTQRRGALGAALASSSAPGAARDPQALRRYLLLLSVAANVESFDRLNQAVLGGLLPQLQRVFRHKPEAVQAAYEMVVEHLYGAEDVGGEAVAALAQLAGRTEDWVEATLLKLLEAHTAGDNSSSGSASGSNKRLPNPILITANWLSQDCYAAGVRSPAALKRLRAEMAAAVVGGIPEAEARSVEEGQGEEALGIDADEAALILQEAVALPIGAHAEGDVETYEALRAGSGSRSGSVSVGMEERARAAKALLEYLRQHDAYQGYTGPVKDTIVGEIEEELRDTIYECSDDLRLDLDPNLVDLKPREHYDVPSLRFRVLNDSEAAASPGLRDGFVEEAGEGTSRPVWRPHDLIPDPSAAKAHAQAQAQGQGKSRGQGQEGGALQQRRWSFAFKDTALGDKKKGRAPAAAAAHAGAGAGATVVRDARTGRLRAASQAEEGRRSWTKRKEGLPLKESA